MAGEIFLGRIGRAFGIRGELKFHPSDDFWENVLHSKHLRLHTQSDEESSERPVAFHNTRAHGKYYVVRMEGIEDRNAAEALVGCEIFIEPDRIDVELPDHVLPYQIIGMTVESDEGENLGEVTSVVYSAAHDLYQVTGEKGEFLVPAVPEFVVSIDSDSRTMVVKPLPGLIEEK